MNFVLACPACAKVFEHIGGNAAGYAILLMLLVVLPILTAIVFFISRMAYRGHQELPAEYKDDLN